MAGFLQAVGIFLLSVFFFLLCAPLMVFAVPALYEWFSARPVPDLVAA